ncbi:MAG: clan AA aspartic protease (TIGR02281 family), partial [Lentisphaeria bacterium]
QQKSATAGDAPTVSSFTALLSLRRYSEALDVYREIDDNFSQFRTAAKMALLQHLTALLESRNDEDFIALANGYLDNYYDDVDVLLSVASFNYKTGLYIEAVGIFQLAREYAYSAEDRLKVQRVFTQFLTELDGSLSLLTHWRALENLYQQADRVDLLDPEQKLRRAQISIASGDTWSAKTQLQALIHEPKVAELASRLLMQLSGDEIKDTGTGNVAGFDEAVALQMHGNQFVIPLGIDRAGEVNLLIDTGASMTTINSAVFAALSSQADIKEVGKRMFNTANGIASGTVYRFAQVYLGRYLVTDVDFAVLQFDVADNVDGLLGMNILGRFKFQIDQETKQLHLRGRQE